MQVELMEKLPKCRHCVANTAVAKIPHWLMATVTACQDGQTWDSCRKESVVRQAERDSWLVELAVTTS